MLRKGWSRAGRRRAICAPGARPKRAEDGYFPPPPNHHHHFPCWDTPLSFCMAITPGPNISAGSSVTAKQSFHTQLSKPAPEGKKTQTQILSNWCPLGTSQPVPHQLQGTERVLQWGQPKARCRCCLHRASLCGGRRKQPLPVSQGHCHHLG